MKYATNAAAARRWDVDPATARAAIQSAGISASQNHSSQRFPWRELLTKIEGWPDEAVDSVDVTEALIRASALADRLEVTPQTVRNYGNDGRFRRIEITPRAIRYAFQVPVEPQSEAKTLECAKE